MEAGRLCPQLGREDEKKRKLRKRRMVKLAVEGEAAKEKEKVKSEGGRHFLVSRVAASSLKVRGSVFFKGPGGC